MGVRCFLPLSQYNAYLMIYRKYYYKWIYTYEIDLDYKVFEGEPYGFKLYINFNGLYNGLNYRLDAVFDLSKTLDIFKYLLLIKFNIGLCKLIKGVYRYHTDIICLFKFLRILVEDNSIHNRLKYIKLITIIHDFTKLCKYGPYKDDTCNDFNRIREVFNHSSRKGYVNIAKFLYNKYRDWFSLDDIHIAIKNSRYEWPKLSKYFLNEYNIYVNNHTLMS